MSAKDRPQTVRAVEICYGRLGLARLMRDDCPKCGSNNKQFRNELSKREHEISGLCQACQDVEFAPSEDEE
jgi:hypothetical protein